MKHTYPDRHRPGQGHWATDVAWEILDVLPPGALTPVQRAFVCGLFIAALESAARTGGPIMPNGNLPKFKD